MSAKSACAADDIVDKDGHEKPPKTKPQPAALAKRENGMAEKSAEFLKKGGKLYV